MALACIGCGKDDNGGGNDPGKGGSSSGKKSTDVTGEWCLSGYDTKAVTIGSESVDVYLAFSSGSFEIYQKLGQGRYRKYSGSYSVSNGILSGKYSDGKPMGSDYEVSRKGDTLTLTAGSEVTTYSKKAIPADVRKEAI